MLAPLLLHQSLAAVCCSTYNSVCLFCTPKRRSSSELRGGESKGGPCLPPRITVSLGVRLLCARYQISQKQQLLEQKRGWAAAGGWQPGLVLTMPPSLSGAAGWLGVPTGLRGDQFVHPLQAKGDKTFPFLRKKAQQGYDQDWGTAGWQVPGLENRAQSTAWCSKLHSQPHPGYTASSPAFLQLCPLDSPKSTLPSSSQEGPMPRIVPTSTPQRYLSSPRYLPDKFLLLCRIRHIVDMAEELLQCLLCALLGLLLMPSVQPASLLRLEGLQLLGARRCQQIQVVLGKRRQQLLAML